LSQQGVLGLADDVAAPVLRPGQGQIQDQGALGVLAGRYALQQALRRAVANVNRGSGTRDHHSTKQTRAASPKAISIGEDSDTGTAFRWSV
jgi:hypothetical protein